eukprot:852906-Alexandrium_andersonii.AAC.1
MSASLVGSEMCIRDRFVPSRCVLLRVARYWAIIGWRFSRVYGGAGTLHSTRRRDELRRSDELARYACFIR